MYFTNYRGKGLEGMKKLLRMTEPPRTLTKEGMG